MDYSETAEKIVDDFLAKEHDDPRVALRDAIEEALSEAYDEGEEDGQEDAGDDAVSEYETDLIELVRDLSGQCIDTADRALEWLREQRDQQHRADLARLRRAA